MSIEFEDSVCRVSLTACRKTEQRDSLSAAESVALEGGEHVILEYLNGRKSLEEALQELETERIQIVGNI